MQIDEFIEVSNRMEQYYDKEYTTEQRQIMYEELKDWNINRYKKAVSIAIRSCKFLPKLADIIQASTEIRETQNNEENQSVECNKCNGTGFIEYKKKANGMIYDFACRCTCLNGQRQDNSIPTYQEIGLKI